MSSEHTAASFGDAEWTAFWRENGKQVTNYTSIFKGTIRQHEWKNQYSAHILRRQLELAPKGTLKVHTFDATAAGKGEIGSISIEPPPEKLERKSGPEAMADAIRMLSPF